MDTSTLPPLDVVGPDGDRLTLRALGRGETVGALARRLGSERLWTTRELHPEERLADIDELRVGARLEASDPMCRPARPDHSVEPIVEVAVVAGPSVAVWQSLPAGRHLVGRAPHARVRLDDAAIEPHHALLRVDTDGVVEIVQLTGAVPIRVDGRTLEQTVVDTRTRLSIGASTLRVRRIGAGPDHGGEESNAGLDSHIGPGPSPATGSVAVHPSDPWRRVVWRAPHDVPRWNAPTASAPTAPVEPQRPSFTGLIGAGVTACGAVVIATIMGNPMFMLFAAMGVIAAITTFIAGVVTTRRKRTKIRTRHAEETAAFSDAVDALRAMRREHHRRVHRTLAETLHEALHGGTRVWQRRLPRRSELIAGRGTPTDGEVTLTAVVGSGTHRWNPPVEVPDRRGVDSTLLQRVERCARLDDVAAPISIRPGDAVAFHGALGLSRAVVRAVVVQLATWTGPADWQLVVVSSDRRAWRWADWLPHGAFDGGSLISVDGDAALGDALDSIDTSRHTVLVTDEPHLFTARTGPVRRFVTASNAAALVVVDTDGTVPAICRRILTVGSTGSASWSGDLVDADDAVSIAFEGISVDTADAVARGLACLVDPEDDGGVGGGVPASVSFAELLPDTSAEAVARRWSEGGADPAPAAPLGTSLEGRVDIDLVRDGPHGLIAGTTGSGKSELLRTLVLSLAASVGPEHLNFVLVDYKGGSTFDACTHLPHTVGLVTDLDEGLAERALVSLDAELHRRERILRSVGAADLTDYRSRRPADGVPREPIARLVVVIDEFAALAKELPDFLKALVGIAQRGRSLGVHLLLATQRPAGVVNDDIRANTNLRLALRLHDKPDAVDVVGDELPAKFPRVLPGRSALRLGPDELVVFQAARCSGPVSTGGPDGIVVDRPERRAPVTSDGPGSVGPGDDIERSELDVAVDAIVEAAAHLGVDAPHRPWVEPLPFPLPLEALGSDGAEPAIDGPVIGWVDDPEHQRRVPLTWRPADGGLALIGSIGSGTTSTLIALAAATCGRAGPDAVHLYVIDGRGDDGLTALASLAHCGGVVRLTEDERLHRLLARVVAAIDRRMSLGGSVSGSEPEIVLMIDGYNSLRSSLGPIERQATFDLLQRVVNDGPAVGIALVVADEGGTAITMVPVAHRWLFHLDDPGVARGFGLRTAPVGHGTPGRLRILASGLEGQVARGAAGLAALPSRDDRHAGGPAPIGALPDIVTIDEIGEAERGDTDPPGLARLVVGVDAADLGRAVFDVVDGDHALIVGGPRSGVSTALERVAAAWEADAVRRCRPFRVVRFGRRTPVDPDVVGDPNVRVALVIDDAHRVDDPGVLADLATGDHPHVTVLAGARADAVRTSYGHWTREIAKSRCGIVMASRSDPDGDVLSVQIPRRPLVPARPGLGWIVDGGPLRQAQIALG